MTEHEEKEKCKTNDHKGFLIASMDFYNGDEHLLQIICRRCGRIIEKLEDKQNDN